MSIYKKKGNNNSNHLVIEKLTDLLKLSPEELKNAHYSDFSGKYFEQINDEVIKLENNPKIIQKEINAPTNNNQDKKEIQNNNENKNIIYKKHNIEYENKNNSINIRNKYIKKEEEEEYVPQYKSIGVTVSRKKKIDVMRNINNIPIGGYNIYNNNEDYFPIRKIIFNIIYNTVFGQEIAISGSSNILGNWDKNRLLFLNWSQGNKWVGEIDLNEDNLEDFEFKFVLCLNKKIICWEPGENNNVYFSGLINEIKEYTNGKYNKYQYEYDRNNGELLLNCKWGS